MRDLGVVVSSTNGMVTVRCLRTMSIGRSIRVSKGLIGLIVACVSSGFCVVFTLDTVMSARGEPCSWVASGDMDGLGVGGARSGTAAMEARGATLLRLRGEAFFGGSSGSGFIVWSASNTSLGSVAAAGAGAGAGVFLGRPRPRLAAGAAADAIDLRLRVCRRGLFVVSGVKSSSSSAGAFVVFAISSSSSESMMAVRLVAARRDGRGGVVADMAGSGCRLLRADV